MNRIYVEMKGVTKLPLYFTTSHASIPKRSMIEFLGALKSFKRGEYNWVSFVRPEKWVIDIMKQVHDTSGILDIGFEFLSNRLDVVNKGTTSKTCIEIALNAYENHVPLWAEFMYGIPGTNIEDIINYLVNIGRIRHCFSEFIIGQMFVEKQSYYYKNPKQFEISILKNPSSTNSFTSYAAFKHIKGQNAWVSINKSFALAISEIMLGKFNDYETPVYTTDSKSKISKETTRIIALKYFPKHKDIIDDSIDYAWSIN